MPHSETEPASMTMDEQFYRDLARQICSSLDIALVLQRLGALLRRYMPLSHLVLVETDEQQCMHVLGEDREQGAPAHCTVFKLSPAMQALMDRDPTLYHANWDDVQRVYLLNDVDAYPLLRECFAEILHTNISYMRVPLDARPERTHLCLYATGKHQYTAEHVRLAGLLREPLTLVVGNIREHERILALNSRLSSENRRLSQDKCGLTLLEGTNKGLARVLDLVRHVAPADTAVLILGETGVGKELVANTIHHLSRRSEGPFIKVNCGAIPENLIDSELFGYARGAFTGAQQDHAGWFERADGGTIFLDEIGDLPLSAQVRLLRVLQFGVIERVGDVKPRELSLRIIAATHRDLRAMVRQGQFREDLWFRLSVFPVTVPPLRDRLEDLESIARQIIHRKCQEMGIHREPVPSREIIRALCTYRWPGNVRELENVIERALIMNREHPAFWVPESYTGITAENDTPTLLDDIVKTHIRQILVRTNGRIQGQGGAAELLGLHPNTLRSRMQKLGMR